MEPNIFTHKLKTVFKLFLLLALGVTSVSPSYGQTFSIPLSHPRFTINEITNGNTDKLSSIKIYEGEYKYGEKTEAELINTYQFSRNGQISDITFHDSDQTNKIIYEGKLLKEMIIYDEKGEIHRILKFSYDDNKLPNKQIVIDKNGSIKYESYFSYNSNNRLKELSAYEINDSEKKEELYSRNYSYDSKERIVKKEYFNDEGVHYKTISYKYADREMEIFEIEVESGDTTNVGKAYLDEEGRWKEAIQFNQVGKPEQYIEHEYESYWF